MRAQRNGNAHLVKAKARKKGRTVVGDAILARISGYPGQTDVDLSSLSARSDGLPRSLWSGNSLGNRRIRAVMLRIRNTVKIALRRAGLDERLLQLVVLGRPHLLLHGQWHREPEAVGVDLRGVRAQGVV